MAAALQKQGASRGATVSFLVATPETGVDSIAVTYALLDPLMTLARPVAAFFTASLAGLAENLVSRNERAPAPLAADPFSATDCGGRKEERPGRAAQVLAICRSALFDIWSELAPSFFIGLLIASVISAALPDGLLAALPGGSITAMLLMLAAGIPMYICASASTPVAAALILKGVSPGAALVFLLAGPATNVATLTVLRRLLGTKSSLVYLAAIAIGSVMAGLALDQLYLLLGQPVVTLAGGGGETMPGWLRYGAASLLLLIPARGLFQKMSASRKKIP